jgi:hypothetical protein
MKRPRLNQVPLPNPTKKADRTPTEASAGQFPKTPLCEDCHRNPARFFVFSYSRIPKVEASMLAAKVAQKNWGRKIARRRGIKKGELFVCSPDDILGLKTAGACDGVGVQMRAVHKRDGLHHGDELPDGLLSQDQINQMLDQKMLAEYPQRRSLYRLFAPFSGAKQREPLDAELADYSLSA